MSFLIPDKPAVLALYGVQLNASGKKEFIQIIASWFALYSCELTHGALNGKGFGGKIVQAPAFNSQSEQANYDNVSGITLISALPNARTPLTDYAIMAEYLTENSTLVVSSRLEGRSILGEESNSVMAELIALAGPAYGIGYVRDDSRGPASYAHGLATGLGSSRPEYLEGLNISFWSDANHERIWENGILRDVYPLNLLTRRQLETPVDSVSLQEWIEADKDNGTLAEIDENMSKWAVAPENVPHVRKELWDKNLIFNWARHLDGADKHPCAAEATLFHYD